MEHNSALFRYKSLLNIFMVTILLYTINTVSSVGTHLLHAGPSCFVHPNGNNSLLTGSRSNVKHRGVCYSTLLCKQKGGVAIGKCGLGNSCCVFPQSCDSVLIRNSTYFTNPHYPQWTTVGEQQDADKEQIEEPQPTSCSLTIHRMPGIHQICQFRLDFVDYRTKYDAAITTRSVPQKPEDQDLENNQILENSVSGSGGSLTSSSANSDDNEVDDDFVTLRGMHSRTHVEENILEPHCLARNDQTQVTIDVSDHIGPFDLTIKPINKKRGQKRSATTPGSSSGGSDADEEQRTPKRRVRWNILVTQIECPSTAVASHATRLATLLNRQPQPQMLQSSQPKPTESAS